METRINPRGNTVENGFIFGIDRYVYDFKWCTVKKGWIQYDTNQDANYFGVWVHPEKRIIKTYAEGDITTVACPTEESYHAELKNMAEFYGNPPPAFRIIHQDGSHIHVYDERPV